MGIATESGCRHRILHRLRQGGSQVPISRIKAFSLDSMRPTRFIQSSTPNSYPLGTPFRSIFRIGAPSFLFAGVSSTLLKHPSTQSLTLATTDPSVVFRIYSGPVRFADYFSLHLQTFAAWRFSRETEGMRECRRPALMFRRLLLRQ